MLKSLVTLFSLVSLNLERIENLEKLTWNLNSTCAAVTMELQTRVGNLERQVAHLSPDARTTTTTGFVQLTTAQTATATSGFCSAVYNGVCYWTRLEYANFAQATEICRSNDSIPAYFPNEEVYDRVINDIRAKIPSERNDPSIWTGITIDTSTGSVNSSSGYNYTRWYPGQPILSFSDWPHIYIEIRKDPEVIKQGMANLTPESTLQGVICQTSEK